MRAPALVVALLAATTSALAAPPPVDCEAPRPAWCQPGYACVPSVCLAALRISLADAIAERDEARRTVARQRKWLCLIGAGVGATLQVHDGHTDMDGAIIPAGILCGRGL